MPFAGLKILLACRHAWCENWCRNKNHVFIIFSKKHRFWMLLMLIISIVYLRTRRQSIKQLYEITLICLAFFIYSSLENCAILRKYNIIILTYSIFFGIAKPLFVTWRHLRNSRIAPILNRTYPSISKISSSESALNRVLNVLYVLFAKRQDLYCVL